MFSVTRIGLSILLIGMLCGVASVPASAQDGAPVATPPAVTTIPTDCCNMQVVYQPNPHYVVTTLDPPIFNFFAGTFANLPTDKEVTIGLNMTDMDQLGGYADVSKWSGLRPLMTYGDITDPATYEWFEKDAEGRWASGDLGKRGAARYAGAGVVPEQTVIPPEVAPQFLSADGRYWQPWRAVERTEVMPDLNILRITHHFAYPTATVAMRYPFSSALLERYLGVLRARQDPRIRLRMFGHSAEGRPLYAIEVKSSRFFLQQPGTLLCYAMEHGSEPDGAHALIGVLQAILSDQLAAWPRLSLIPIYDPDSVAACRYEGMLNSFDLLQMTPESTALAAYARAFVADNKHLDTVLGLHNVESGEAGNLWMPHADFMRWWAIKPIKERVDAYATARGYTVTPSVREMTFQGNRFEGWTAKELQTVSLLYEVNAQAPGASPLTLKQLHGLGAALVAGVDDSQMHDDWLREMRQRRY